MNDFHNCIQKFLNYETGRAWVVCGSTTMSSLSEGPSLTRVFWTQSEGAGRHFQHSWTFPKPGIEVIGKMGLALAALGAAAGVDGGSPTLVQNGRFAKESRALAESRSSALLS